MKVNMNNLSEVCNLMNEIGSTMEQFWIEHPIITVIIILGILVMWKR
jgi:hypothetical protein